MKLLTSAVLALALTAPLSAYAANDSFSLSYHVERVGSQKMDVGKCLSVATQASNALGYKGAVTDRHGAQLAVCASGPAGGGASLVVYCIAVETKTTFVVQAIDYNNNAARAQQAADRVYQTLLSAAN